jgi:hypothetical protein
MGDMTRLSISPGSCPHRLGQTAAGFQPAAARWFAAPGPGAPASGGARGAGGQSHRALLPGEMGAAQQALLAGEPPLFQLLLTEGVEELARAPARRTDRCALPIRPQPAWQGACRA